MAQPGDVLLCCLVHRCRIMPPFTVVTASCCTIAPEQLSKRERYNDKWQRRTHPFWRHWHGTHLPTGIYNVTARLTLVEKRGLKLIRQVGHAASGVSPEPNEGWYQVRISGVMQAKTKLSPVDEPLANGAVIHIVPRLAAPKAAVFFRQCWVRR